MKKNIKVLSLILVFTLLFSIPCNLVSAESMASDSSKITEKLAEALENGEKEELIPVDVWFKGVDEAEIESEVKAVTGYNKESLAKESLEQAAKINGYMTTAKQSKKYDAYILAEREISKAKQNIAHEKFLKTVDLEGLESKIIFKSQYAPMISMDLTKNEIEKLSQDSRVLSIYYRDECQGSDSCNVSVPLIRANYTRDTFGLTGSGIKVGQIESGMPSKTATPDLAAANITYDPNVSYYNTLHANEVASIIIEIAPDVQIYSTRMTGNWKARVEWLLSQGVNVINMSHGFSSTGTYGSNDMWVDHIAIMHSVHYVVAAGNNGGYVASPGMAYNVITVGAIDDNNTSYQSDDAIASYSSYTQVSGNTTKPDLVAPGSNITTDAGTDSGTSFAAPHVTAVVAQMLHLNATLKTKQAALKAIITASVNHDYIHYETSQTTNFNIYGAGLVDAQGSRYTVANGRYASSTFAANSANGSTVNYYFNVSSSDDQIRVSLTWDKHSYITGSHTTGTPTLGRLADLDLYVYDPNGNLIEYATSGSNNLEIVDFEPTMVGQYRIMVKQYSNSDKVVYYGVAWW